MFSQNSLTIFSLTKNYFPHLHQQLCSIKCGDFVPSGGAAAARHGTQSPALHCLHRDGSTEMTATAIATRRNAPPPPPYIVAALGRFLLRQQAFGCVGRRGGNCGRQWRCAGGERRRFGGPRAAIGGDLAVRGWRTAA